MNFFLKAAALFFGLCFTQAMEGANTPATDKEWQEALVLCQQQDASSAAVLVRMGECHAHLKAYPQALHCWRTAALRLYWLWYYQIMETIFKLEAEIGLHGAQPLPLWYVMVAIGSVPPLLWQIILLLLLLLAAWRMGMWWRIRAYALLVLVWSGIVLCGGLAVVGISQRHACDAVVSEKATLRSGPDARFTELGILPAGEAIKRIGSGSIGDGEKFYKVQAGALRGWAPQKAFLALA